MATLEITTVQELGNHVSVYVKDDALESFMNDGNGLLIGIFSPASILTREDHGDAALCSFVKAWWCEDKFLPTGYYQTQNVAEIFRRSAQYVVSEWVKYVTAEEMLNKK